MDSVFIAHDLTKEQAAAFYESLGKHYNILPLKYDESQCFHLFEKGTEVWEVSYEKEWNGKIRCYTDAYADLAEAKEKAQWLSGFEDCMNIKVQKIF